MESGGSSNLQHKHTRRAPTSGIVIGASTAFPQNASDVNIDQSFKREPDQYMPIANVTRIMRRILPSHAKIADDAKETIQECVSEFISFITSEANEKCHREYRKTITSEDVLSAMKTLGFDNYIEPLTIFLNKYRADEDPDRNPFHHAPYTRQATGHALQPMAQMAQQPPPPPPPFTMNYGRPQLPITYAVDPTNYVDLPPMYDYFMASQGGGESSSNNLEFDAFRQFK